jgi:putative glutamine amidotransferase
VRPLIAIPRWRAPTWERTKYYYDSIEAAGADYAVVAGDDLPTEALGLVLAGGVDVDPALYGEKKGPKTDRPKRERDRHEIGLLRQAMERDIAVLCICRGHQLLNVAMGGSLLQDIEDEGHRWHDDDTLTSRFHEVSLSGGRIASVYDNGGRLRVNSRHHQGVTPDGVAPGLDITAISTDGFVECLESREHRWVVGVQWHPERPEVRAESKGLWRAFVEAAAARPARPPER